MIITIGSTEQSSVEKDVIRARGRLPCGAESKSRIEHISSGQAKGSENLAHIH
jgi:hypothetical protein